MAEKKLRLKLFHNLKFGLETKKTKHLKMYHDIYTSDHSMRSPLARGDADRQRVVVDANFTITVLNKSVNKAFYSKLNM